MNGGIVLDLIPKDPSIKTIERGTDVFLDAIGSFDDCVLNSKSSFFPPSDAWILLHPVLVLFVRVRDSMRGPRFSLQ